MNAIVTTPLAIAATSNAQVIDRKRLVPAFEPFPINWPEKVTVTAKKALARVMTVFE
jgi:hypothetical protein